MKDLAPVKRIIKGIYLIRGKKVMVDRESAELYGVDNAQLKKAVRSIERLPTDFMSIEAILCAGTVVPPELSFSSNALQAVPAMRKG